MRGTLQTVSSVACHSDLEIQPGIQSVEAVVRTQIHRLDAYKVVPMFSGGWTWQKVRRDDVDPCRFESSSGLSHLMYEYIYSPHIYLGIDQHGKVASPARGQKGK